MDVDDELMGRRLRAIDLMSGGKAEVSFSRYTHKFYVESPLSMTDGHIETGFTEHRDSPYRAVGAYWERMLATKYGGKDFIRIKRGDDILGAQYDDETGTFIYFTLAELRALTKD
jgi:hypothetical protein